MAKANSIPPSAHNTYTMLGIRLQAVINSPKAQSSKSAFLERLPSDRAEDWDQLFDEISENDNVTIEHKGKDTVQVSWTVPQED